MIFAVLGIEKKGERGGRGVLNEVMRSMFIGKRKLNMEWREEGGNQRFTSDTAITYDRCH